MRTTLFPIARARNSDPQTSHDAAKRVTRSGNATRHRQMILDALKGGEGLTVEQISQATGVHKSDLNKRTSELEHAGLIRRSGVHHGMLICWITEAGRQA